MFQLDSMERPHECMFLDEAGFNHTKRWRRGRYIIGQRAIVELPGWRGGNVTICAAISSYGVIHRHVTVGPYNTAHLLTFLYALQEALLRREQRGDEQAEHPMYVVIWDDVNFHRGPRICEWFENNPRFINVCLPPYSPFLNPLKNFFFFCMEVEGLWQKSLCTGKSHSVNGCSMWQHWSGSDSRLDSAC